ncbi:alpha/beta-hydrolase [Rhexocercosporidium sp. MPI-PUGE-AT-0058]|nr:alpha/beta-hydrolase [Rhexocercosporidium sp. MPI-PUGE-AT-0058]
MCLWHRTIMRSFAIFCVIVCWSGCCLASRPTTTIANGTIVGRSLPEFNQDLFLGIPYADPPSRFSTSIARTTKFNGSFNASNFSAVCHGTGGPPAGNVFSENCLTLNIIRQSTTTTNSTALPVVIWIHGGGFWGGSAADPNLNGSYIVQKSVAQNTPIIFVSIQYRLLFYGFPSGNEPHALGRENLGLLDQRLAFQWVQENIAAFGGDPTKVTIMGESAGGTGILQHLVAYGGRNDHLFRAAIVQSGSFYDVPCNWNVSTIREANYQSFLNETGCDGFSCLQTLDNEILFNVSLKFFSQFLPSIDGTFMPAHPVELFDQGKQISVPLLMGVNDDEGTILVQPGSNTTEDIKRALMGLNGSSYVIDGSTFERLFELYPDDPAAGVPHNTGAGVPPTGFMDKTSYLIFGDAVEHSVRRWITGLYAQAGNAVYSYRFAQIPWHGSVLFGATHGVDISYVFGTSLGPRPSDLRLSRYMIGAWASFVHSLNPNYGDFVLEWPDYRVAGQNMVLVADGEHAEEDVYRTAGLALWTEQRIQGCAGLRAGV